MAAAKTALDRRALLSQFDSSRRSIMSESESEVGSLLSGLSQARKIPDRRKRPTTITKKEQRSGNARKSSRNKNGTDWKKTTSRRENPGRMKQKNEQYRKEEAKIIKLQAFARGYMTRFSHLAQMTMEKTKRKFFAIQIQAHVRGFLQRQRYLKLIGGNPLSKHTNAKKRNGPKSAAGGSNPSKRWTAADKSSRGQPKNNNRNSRNASSMGTDSERSEVSFRLERPTVSRMDRLTSSSVHASERFGESESDVGSIMSNLSVARKVPDRRRKREVKESQATKIQALARGYIQRNLYKSLIVLEQTKQKFSAITIQAYCRGYLQRKNGPQVSRDHVTPKREPLAAPRTKREDNTISSDSHRKQRRREKSSHQKLPGKPSKRTSRREKETRNTRMPVRNRGGFDEGKLPRELTIRKPRRHLSDEFEKTDLPPTKQLTIRQPRRQRSDSDNSESERSPPRRAITEIKSTRTRNGVPRRNTTEPSPPRRLMLKGKKSPQASDNLEKSQESLEPDKLLHGRRAGMMTLSLGTTSSSRFGESESDMGSLMSGLSQARKVPDRRLKQPSKRGFSRNGKNDLEAKSAIKIQALGRGYIDRFAFKSRMIMEQTKRRFFAIQIQAAARGYLTRLNRLKSKQA